MRIGELAKQTGTSADTVRYYERVEILPQPLEQAGAALEPGDTESKRMTVRFGAERLSRADVVAAMEAVGFPPEGEETP